MPIQSKFEGRKLVIVHIEQQLMFVLFHMTLIVNEAQTVRD